MNLTDDMIARLISDRKYPKFKHLLLMLSGYFAVWVSRRSGPSYPGELYDSYPDAMKWVLRTPLVTVEFLRDFPVEEDSSLHSGWRFGFLPNPTALFQRVACAYYFNADRTKVTANKSDIRKRRIALEG